MLGQKTGIGVFREGQIEEKRKKERFSVDDKRSPTSTKGKPTFSQEDLSGGQSPMFWIKAVPW